MTTKPKTRKPAAKTAAPKPAKVAEKFSATTNETAGIEPKREVSEIRELVTRWRWLEADAAYQAAKAPTDKESERLIAIHYGEQKEIERKLATLIPESFSEVCKLLEFATEMIENDIGNDHTDNVLRNVRAGLSEIWCKDMKAEREKGMTKMREAIGILFDISGRKSLLKVIEDQAA